MNYRELIESTGGFSESLDSGLPPTSGYMVSASGLTRRISLDNFLDSNVHFYAAQFAPLPNLYVGGWLSDGIVYLDLSENIQDRETAIQAGIERNQIAIWDIVNQCEIPTGGTGE
jgi:hypothetical protein